MLLHCTALNTQTSLTTNKPFMYSVGGSLLGQLAVIYFPPLQRVFQTEALSLMDITFILCLAFTLVVLDTVRKR
jgi:P-type Ca2+ transporter type 2C